MRITGELGLGLEWRRSRRGTTTTYALHPAPGTTEERNSLIIADPRQDLNETENSGPDGGLAVGFGRDISGVYYNGFFRVDFGATLPAPVARSVIKSAALRLRAAAVDASALSCGVCLLARDGVWDAPTGTLGYGVTASRSCSLQLYTLAGGLGTQIVTTGASSTLEWGIKGGTPSPELFRDTMGQSVLIGGTANCGSAVIAMNRVGTPDGMLTVEIYACVASDGTNDRPTGSPIATSVTVVPTTLTTSGTGAPVIFDFTSPPSLVSGNRYVALVQWSGTPSATNYVRVTSRTATPYADGSTIVGTHRYAFHRNSYVRPRHLPHLFDTPLNGDIRNAPYGGAANYDTVEMPTFAAIGTYYEIDLTRFVQQWVNDASFTPDFLGVHIAPVFGTAGGGLRGFDAAELRVTYRPRPPGSDG